LSASALRADGIRIGSAGRAALVHPILQGFDWQDIRTNPAVVLLARGHAFAGQEAVGQGRLAQLPFTILCRP
jgi:hypothetical protein